MGQAAHITAAAANGPRYDKSLTPTQRKHADNGIWLCSPCATQVDQDDAPYTVAMLQDWKRNALDEIDKAVTTGKMDHPASGPIALEPEVYAALGISENEDVEVLTRTMRDAALADLETFAVAPMGAMHTVSRHIVRADGGVSFGIRECANLLRTHGAVTIAAPPGMGKSTTLKHLAHAVMDKPDRVAVFVALADWAIDSAPILASLVHRRAYRKFREQHFMFLAEQGRLSLFLDGWNELDGGGRGRALVEVRRLQQNYTLIEIALTTRDQVGGTPQIEARLELEPLSYGQQIELATALAGDAGEKLVDDAWRTAGLADLISVPLYLTALARRAATAALPETKEEVLRVFVEEHEQSPEARELLRSALLDLHRDYLVALATGAADGGTPVLREDRARQIIATTVRRLRDNGQLGAEPQPAHILERLIAAHTLVWSTEKKSVAFQHEQFQEWFASFEAENYVLQALDGNDASRSSLRGRILDLPRWEEPILFACERLSRADDRGSTVVASAVLEALSVDPMLAAEMIYRSSSAVWAKVGDRVIAFATRWHRPGVLDRASRFMMLTGNEAFRASIWPLVNHADDQIRLSALRIARPFRPSVLGTDARAQIEALGEDLRTSLLSEIAYWGAVDGMNFAVAIGKEDQSSKVQAALVQALRFRRGDRHIAELMSSARPGTWELLAQDSDVSDLQEPIRKRVVEARTALIRAETDPFKRLQALCNEADIGQSLAALEDLIASPDVSWRRPEADYVLYLLSQRCPDALAQGLVRRIEANLQLPLRYEEFLLSAPQIDEGPLSQALHDWRQAGGARSAAILVAGPKTVAALIKSYLEAAKQLSTQQPAATREEVRRLGDLIGRSRRSCFIEAWLAESETADPEVIAILTGLLFAYRGRAREEKWSDLPEPFRPRVVERLQQYAQTIRFAADATRQQRAIVAQAVGRFPDSSLTESVCELATADFDSRERARAERLQGRSDNDAYISNTLLYARVLAALADDGAMAFLVRHLENSDFGPDAANALVAIWRHRNGVDQDEQARSVDFEALAAVRGRRWESNPSSPFSDQMFTAVNNLTAESASAAQISLGLKLAGSALRIPYGDKREVIDRLLNLDSPSANKLQFVLSLVWSGESVPASIILTGIEGFLAEAATARWMLLDQGNWPLRQWLAILPLSDRPRALFDGLNLLPPEVRQFWPFEDVLDALGSVRNPETPTILIELAQAEPRLYQHHQWVRAFMKQGTREAYLALLTVIDEMPADLFRSGVYDNDEWFAKLAAADPAFQNELLERYRRGSRFQSQRLIEGILAHVPTEDFVIAMVGQYAERGRSFGGNLHTAIEALAVKRVSHPESPDMFELQAEPVPGLRRRLFALTTAAGPSARVAIECLSAIDDLRDEHGRPADEPRHPDVSSGQPWPPV